MEAVARDFGLEMKYAEFIGKLARIYQRSTMNRFFATHKYSWNFEYEWLNSMEIQLHWLIRTLYNIA